MGRRRNPTVHGWLVLDKPLGLSSNAALSRLKRLFDTAKVGHAGTLDPLATGLLPVAFGEATKTVPYIVDGAKTYRFDVIWGARTSTDDAEGEIVATSDIRPTHARINAVLPKFTGSISQVPPQFSAIKVDGERAYARARAGEDMVLTSRNVEIHRLVLAGQGDDEAPMDRATFICDCGKGTYIRSLARDIGSELGCEGHVGALRRLRVDPFSEADMVTFDQLETVGEAGPDGLAGFLRPVQAALGNLVHVNLSLADAATLRRGQPVLLRGRDAPVVAGAVCALSEGHAVAICEAVDGSLHPRRVFQH